MNATPTLHDTLVGESGPTVVFLHGLFGQGRNFTAIAKALVPDFRSLLVDLPNHGRSGWTDDVDYEHVADLVADHLREGVAAEAPVHLVGHSMGGKVAMVLALRHPDLVDRLVVVDISPVDSPESSEFAHLLDSLAAVDLSTLTRRGEADERLTGPIGDARVRGFLLQNLRESNGAFAWQANLAVLRDGLAEIGDFPRVDGVFERPVLWISGERSPYVQDAHEPEMRRLFPLTRLVTIKGAGHWVHAEEPDTFVTALRVFLTG
ncbi:hydrolase, alpha/beta domain protein [Aeromicrobium marinum DSM 15272]|uniref:Hydrolase, alpha/beta domain protein n=1 Tax=Aeromicrobium marinum DSM 15272 TaxID=585531 RepID=E2S9T7_9ACTN|nr:alpha/beta fold hydrolase [Aeromicrobium marinum]EFQ84011.1 hydrolase, alpha/beta domain protein [Aeromicrobium marinum DSM 15272]